MEVEIDLRFLEDIIAEQEKAGQEWAKVKQLSTRLEEGRKTMLAKLMNTISATYETTGTKVTESRIEREALASKEYGEYIKVYADAVGAELGARTHYETLKNHFEARRSWVSLEKAKTQIL